MNRHLSKKDTQMGNRHMKRCSTSLIVRGTQIKNTMRYYFTPVRVPTIQKGTNNKSGEGVEKRGPRALLLKMETGAATIAKDYGDNSNTKNRTNL